MRLIRFLLVCVMTGVAAMSAVAEAEWSLEDVRLPDGFAISLYADDVEDARSLALGDAGTVFVATRQAGNVYALIPQDQGQPRRVLLAEGLQLPNGIAWHRGDLYVAELTRILRFADIEQHLSGGREPELVYDELPAERHHGWRFIDFGPDDRLYVSIGAPCNVCNRDGFALIGSMQPDGSDWRVEARGIRNSVGFSWHPQTAELWFTDNGRDLLGDNRPPGELNRVRAAGQHFGFPFCHGGDLPDPEFGKRRDCAEFVPPAQKLGPHVAPLGVIFYTGDLFPEEYRNQILIAEHGSWNRSKKIGYRISQVTFEEGRPVSYKPFADGWLHGNEQVSGRPVDLLQLPDGSLLVSDDQEGRIYRITYTAATDGDDRQRSP